MTRRLTATGARLAFTLVEMVVTIGVIIILTALTVSATIALTQRAEVGQTEDTIRLLDMALVEWETQADRKLTWGPSGSIADVTDGTPHVYTLTEVLSPIRRAGQVRTIMAQIKPEFVYQYHFDNNGEPVYPPWLPLTPDADDPDPLLPSGYNPREVFTSYPDLIINELAVLDAWGVPIRAVHPGRLHAPAPPPAGFGDPLNTRDLDGTIWVHDQNSEGWNEAIYGRCENRRVRFVSAGPDGKFGNLSLSADDAIHQQAHDNVYSYRPEDNH